MTKKAFSPRVAAGRFGDRFPGAVFPFLQLHDRAAEFGFVAEPDLGQVPREDLFAEEEFRFFDEGIDHERVDRADFDAVFTERRFAEDLPVDAAFVERRGDRFGRQFEFRAALGGGAFDRFRGAFARFAEAGGAQLAEFVRHEGGREVDAVFFAAA